MKSIASDCAGIFKGITAFDLVKHISKMAEIINSSGKM
jgi:hypothetical protein